MKLFLFLLTGFAVASLSAQTPRAMLPAPFDQYLRQRVAELSSADWQAGLTPETWPAKQEEMRTQLREMLGLSPWPERSPLQATVTGQVEGDGYFIEKLHFQSLPGLYVTANLYRPAEVTRPLPTILYVCGHSNVVENGVSLGNKTGYQHHGIWFARHGYVCLVLDTVQLGEIRGEHHGTYRLGRWWWTARGYTPAGVEAWNGIRALDYLETRPEVDRTRFGVTGRSGGGAYSWWIAALDERIQVAVPVAGITTLHDHTITGAIEGHCDCMFMVNTARWDFDRVAALVAPRPLLISNTDKDDIFPLEGVLQIHARTRAIYRALGREENLGLHLAEGPHKDTQPLNFGAFEWMNRHLQRTDRADLIEQPARKLHPPRELKVFASLPADEKVTTVDEWFGPQFRAPVATADWPALRDGWMKALRRDCFRAWPAGPVPVNVEKPAVSVAEGLRLTAARFDSQAPFRPTLWLLHREDLAPQELEFVVLRVLDDAGWDQFRAATAAGFPQQFPGATASPEAFAEERRKLLGGKWAVAYVCPRGAGPESWRELPERKRTHLLRRLHLLGESLESGQVWDITQAATALRSLPGLRELPLRLQADGVMAANALYASLFIPPVAQLDLHALPASHRHGPIYLNVLRHLDLPQAVALAAERSTVVLHTDDPAPWRFAQQILATQRWPLDRLQIRPTADSR